MFGPGKKSKKTASVQQVLQSISGNVEAVTQNGIQTGQFQVDINTPHVRATMTTEDREFEGTRTRKRTYTGELRAAGTQVASGEAQVVNATPQISTPQVRTTLPTEETQAPGPNSSKRVRGPTTGKGLSKLNNAITSGKLPINIPIEKGRPTNEVQSAKLSSEIGVISQRFIGIPDKWKKLEDEDKCKFQIDLEDEYVKDSVEKRMQHASRQQRYRLHQIYKKFATDEEARRNKPHNFKLTDAEWNAFCDKWSDPKHQAKDNEEPNRIEFWKDTHFDSKTQKWKSDAAKTLYVAMVEKYSENAIIENPMTIDEIADSVLGTNSSYIKGLGYGPIKPTKDKAAHRRVIELEDTLKKTQDELDTCRNKLEHVSDTFQAQLDAMVARQDKIFEVLRKGGFQSISMEELEQETISSRIGSNK